MSQSGITYFTKDMLNDKVLTGPHIAPTIILMTRDGVHVAWALCRTILPSARPIKLPLLQHHVTQ